MRFLQWAIVIAIEDFIRYAATRSVMSGKKYRIHCPGDESEYAANWLLSELNKYRNNNN